MLSIGKAQGGYYVSLAKDDYYTQGGEPNGVWHGRGAEALGYTGEIDKEAFLKLCDGVGKNGEALTQNAGDKNHVAGWDLTFSALAAHPLLRLLSTSCAARTRCLPFRQVVV